MSLKGKSAIVTGSTSGIGLGIAERLAQAGANVMLNGSRAPAEAEKLRQDIAAKHKTEVAYTAADMTKGEDRVRLVKETEKAFGKVDILVNNAGIQFVSKVEDFPLDKWNEVIAVNLTSIFHLIKLSLPGMKQRKWGRVINIASVHGLIGSTKKAAYTAAKHGLMGLTKVVALEYCTHGITCNSICPGWVRTPLVERQIEAIAKEKGISIDEAVTDLLSEKQPSLQFATPSQMGGLAAFLASEDAAQITGTAIPVDGGWTAR
jgi:3-hydroxybutyrate dehydrogenase